MTDTARVASAEMSSLPFFHRLLIRLQHARMETAWEVIHQHRDLLPPNYFTKSGPKI